MIARTVACLDCGQANPLVPRDPSCSCGGLLAIAPVEPPDRRQAGLGDSLARFQSSFPLPAGARVVSLGERPAPLEPLRLPGIDPGHLVQRDDLLPSGSWQVRGAALQVAAHAALGHDHLVCAASGDGAYALAHAAAAAGLRLTAFAAEEGPRVWPTLLARAGARVASIAGGAAAVQRALRDAVHAGATWACPARQPLHAAGAASAAFELVQSLGRVPAAVAVPVDDGGYAAGVAAGFVALQRLLGGALPRIFTVQAERDRARPPLRARELDAALARCGGGRVKVSALTHERALRLAWREGLRIEPSAALGIAALIDPQDALATEREVIVLLGAHGVRAGHSLIEGL